LRVDAVDDLARQPRRLGFKPSDDVFPTDDEDAAVFGL
jgi:hypothetical protein